MITRRAVVAGALGLGACGPKLAKRFNGYALVANQGSRTLAVVNLTRFRTEKQISLPVAPGDIVPIRAGSSALVQLPDAGAVLEVTAQSRQIARKAKVPGRLVAMRTTANEGTLWLLSSDPAALTPVDLATWAIGRPILLPSLPRDFDVTADGGTAAVTYADSKHFNMVDLRRGAITAQTELPTEPALVRFRRDGKQLLIGSAAGRTITVADRANGQVLVILPLSLNPERFCFNDNGGQMFVTGQGMDAVAIVYPYQTEIAETVLAGRQPGAMAVNESLLFVTNPPTGDTTVIGIADRKVVARIPSGEEPCSVTLTPDGEYALILNRKSGDIAVVRISKLTDLRYKRAPLFTLVAVGEDPVSAAILRL